MYLKIKITFIIILSFAIISCIKLDELDIKKYDDKIDLEDIKLVTPLAYNSLVFDSIVPISGLPNSIKLLPQFKKSIDAEGLIEDNDNYVIKKGRFRIKLKNNITSRLAIYLSFLDSRGGTIYSEENLSLNSAHANDQKILTTTYLDLETDFLTKEEMDKIKDIEFEFFFKDSIQVKDIKPFMNINYGISMELITTLKK